MYKNIGGSSNGRTADFGSAYLGSNPSPPAKLLRGREVDYLATLIRWRSCGANPTPATKLGDRLMVGQRILTPLI